MRVQESDYESMKLAVKVAAQSRSEDERVHPLVGAVLSGEDGRVIMTASRGEGGPGTHAEYHLLKKMTESGVLDLSDKSLYVTLEPCTNRSAGKNPCAQRIVESGLRKVFIGMLDPNTTITGHGETYLRQQGLEIERFPNVLVRKIEELNQEFVELWRRSHLPSTSLYVSRRISDIMLGELKKKGYHYDELPSDPDTSIDDLHTFCMCLNDSVNQTQINKDVSEARSLAFDLKYADYDYAEDARSLGNMWLEEVVHVVHRLGVHDLQRRRVVNVGIGNGLEGKNLLDECRNLTIVDIGNVSLQNALQRLPFARALPLEAEKLSGIKTGTQDVYLSLRTYQSAFFGVTPAVREAYRVVRLGGIVVISVANGYLAPKDHAFVPGMLIRGSTEVDRDRPFELANKIRRLLTRLKFEDVGVITGFCEIYVFGRRA